MVHKQASDSRLIRGLVLDHGGRHADMPTELRNCHILTANVSLEYEKTEVHSGFYFSTAEQREKLVQSERKFTDERCMKIIELKRQVCKEGESFVLINQKGIDPVCLEMLAKENIIGLRRAKRRNMERLMLSCGGRAVNSVEDLTAEDLGWADHVYQETLGDDKFTFVEGCKNPKSCSILVKGPDQHTIAQLKEAIRDGLRAVKNLINDSKVIPGAGSFEIFAHQRLMEYKNEVKGKAKLGVEAFAKALLVIPKILSENAGYDVQDAVIMLQDEFRQRKVPTGINLTEFGVLSPDQMGIFDNYCVKKLFISLSNTLAQQLLLCDEILKAGKQMGNSRDESALANAPRH
jgi:T-complex protein 1 subunit zeta